MTRKVLFKYESIFVKLISNSEGKKLCLVLFTLLGAVYSCQLHKRKLIWTRGQAHIQTHTERNYSGFNIFNLDIHLMIFKNTACYQLLVHIQAVIPKAKQQLWKPILFVKKLPAVSNTFGSSSWNKSQTNHTWTGLVICES